MREQKNLIRKMTLKTLIFAVTAITTAFPVAAQDGNITLPNRNLSAKEVFETIQQQTSYKVIANSSKTDNLSVRITRSPSQVKTVLNRLLEGSGLTYRMDGTYILVVAATEPQPGAATFTVTTPRNVAGTVSDEGGNPLEGVTVELVGMAGKSDTTHINGRFLIEGVMPGRHISKLTSADWQNVRYREIIVPEGGDADVAFTFNGEIIARGEQEDTTTFVLPKNITPKTAAYFVPKMMDNTIRAFTDEPKTQFTYIPTEQITKDYMPKAAIKTNLLYLGTTTLNFAAEFGLAKKWTLDLSAAYNPFMLQKGGVNKIWFVQPEARYWFCQRFEKHFIGLHGIYGEFNVGNVTFLTKTFETHRYDGWAAGAGISYGYHLPIAKRWAMEFTVGAGYLYMKYDQFRCYECDEFDGNKGRHYFGPTKAGVSLIFMIK